MLIHNQDYQTSPELQAFPTSEKIISSIVHLSLNKLSILRDIINCHELHGDVYYSRNKWAKSLDCTPKTITNYTNALQADGMITKGRPGGRPFATCHYVPTDFILTQKKRIFSLYKYLKGVGFAINLLVSKSQVQPSMFPLNSYKEFNLLKNPETPETNGSALCSVWQWTKRQVSTKQVSHTTKKEEKVMKQDWINPAIRSATGIIGLSKWGQIRLSAYPYKAVEYAINAFKKSRTTKVDRFGWVIKICNDWCKQNNTLPDWDLMHRLAEEHNMPSNPALVTTDKNSPDIAPFMQPITTPKPQNTSGYSDPYLKYRALKKPENKEWARLNYEKVLIQAQLDGNNMEEFAEKFITWVTSK